MFLNKAILIGFLGGDAEVRTGKNNQKFTTIVFGKLGEFAATLKKGAHIQIEGEIRHSEYTPKKAKKPVRTDSIRVNSILKLDRAEKAAPEDQEADEQLPFDEATE
jgi:single-strand DNA-binding protein